MLRILRSTRRNQRSDSAGRSADAFAITISLATLLVALACPAVPAGEPGDGNNSPRKSGPPRASQHATIRIAKETTFVTEPLDNDGNIDLAQALNNRLSAGVTPSSNTVVALIETIGPGHIPAPHREAYFRLLGIPILSGEGDYLVSYHEFARQRGVSADNFPRDAPWTAADDPPMAEWHERYDTHLDRIVEAAHRPHYYAPLVADRMAAPALTSVLLPGVQKTRSVARGLMSRIMLRLGDGREEDALRDIEALHRFGSQVGRGGTLIEGLIGIAIRSMAVQAELRAVHSPRVTEAMLAAYLKRVSTVPTASMREKIDLAERLMYVDLVVSLSGGGPGAGILGELGPVPRAPAGIDWNVALIAGNRWYDRIELALSYETYAEQQAALAELMRELEAIAAQSRNPLQIAASALFGNDSTAVAENFGGTLVALVLPAAEAANQAENRIRAMADLGRLSAALRIHHLRHGSYPSALSELDNATKLNLLDRFSDALFKYELREGGYLLYSVGANRRDDSASSQFSSTLAGEWVDRDAVDVDGDDLVIRIPLRSTE